MEMMTQEEIKKVRKELFEGDERLTLIFSALSDPGRFRIVKLLMNQKDVCVTDVAHIFDISVSAASQQLKILEVMGLVRRERMGQMICYEIKRGDTLVKAILRILQL